MPKATETLLFPVIDHAAHEAALFEDAKKVGWINLPDGAYCELLSGIWAWNEDKTKSVLADRFNITPYYYYVSSRGVFSSASDRACHSEARYNVLHGLTTIPLRYWDAYSSSNTAGNLLNQPTSQIVELCGKKKKEYRTVTGYKFDDFVRFYNWYLSEQNPMFGRFKSLMKTFEIHKNHEGHPVGFTCLLKKDVTPQSAYTTVGLFLCMSRFLSEGFEQTTTKDRRNLYKKLNKTVPDYVLYPVIEAFTSPCSSHRWFNHEHLDLDKWFDNSFKMNSTSWTHSFGTGYPGGDYETYLKNKGFIK